MCGFIDLNGDGDFADASETASATVPNGSNDAAILLNFGVAPPGTAPAGYARFRLSTAAGCAPDGPSPDGEIEDYAFTALVTDLGDLPDTAPGTGSGNYQTLLADGGAVHPIIAGLFMGSLVDAESDGQPSAIASGDDLLTSDDEDGVDTASLAFVVGQSGSVNVSATNLSGSMHALAFYRFDQNGSISPAVEVSSVAVPNGSNGAAFVLPFNKPLNTPSGPTFARFRLSTDTAGACAVAGLAGNGEVEDYVVDVRRIDLGDLPDSGPGIGTGNYQTLIADGGPQHDIVPGLFLGASVDNEANGQASVNADGDVLGGTPDDEDGVNLADLVDIPAGLHTGRTTASNLTGTRPNLGVVDQADGDFDERANRTQAVPAQPMRSSLVSFQSNLLRRSLPCAFR